MNDNELVEKINAIPKWQQRIVFNDNVQSPGTWDPRLQFDMFSSYVDFRELRVLDIGANAGGLSFLLREAGANVVAAEPMDVHQQQIKLYMDYKNITNIRVTKNDLFSVHELGEFDVIFCLGLFYHFRHPQYVLDYLASMHQGALFISTQIIDGDDLVMQNRRSHDTTESSGEKPLSGWEPTIALFERMLLWAGFKDFLPIHLGRKPGMTNSAYYFIPADPDRRIDIDAALRKFM